MKRLLNFFSLLALLTGHLTPALAKPTPQPETQVPNEDSTSRNGIRVLRADTNGLTLALDTPETNLQRREAGGFEEIILPGGDTRGEPGHPQVPVVSGWIGVPPGAEVTVQITRGEGKVLEGQYTLPPGPRPLPLEDDLEPGEMEIQPDPDAYAVDAWSPSVSVEVGEEAWVRDQRMMRVSFFPIQYNPAQRALRLYEHLQVEIAFTGGKTATTITQSAFENLFANTLLNYEVSRYWRVSNPQAPSTFQSLGPRFDMTVHQDGIYRVTYTDLQTAGMDVDSINPTTFHLYNQGEDVAIYVSGEEDDSFDPGDYVTFFGEKFRGDLLAERYASSMTRNDGAPENNWFWLCLPGKCDLAGAFEQYTDDNIYSLTVGGTPGPRMGTVPGDPTGGTVPDVYTTTVRAEQSNYWWAYEFESEDIWFWSQIQKSTSTLPFTDTYTINLTNVASVAGNATIHAEVASRNATSGFPDHHTQYKINTSPTLLDDTYWDGRTRHEMTVQVPQSDLVEGTNTLYFTMQPDVSTGITRMYFDFFEITYFREFVAENNQLAFKRFAPGTWQYEIDGFTSSTAEVYNLTDRFLPVRVLNPTVTGSGPYTAKFKATDGATASYFVVGSDSILSPASILNYQPPDFANMPEADYLFITHKNFIASLQPLADYREAQGLSVAIIDVDELYREFNDGIYHPIAIKNFLTYTFENWETPPSYVTLVGSGHWNFKNDGAVTEVYANPPPVYMPPNLAYIDPWQGQTDSANLLATIVGDDLLPDLHIARMPVSTPAELDEIVNKTLSFEGQPVTEWHRNITFIADNIPDPAQAGDFVALAESIIADYLEGNLFYKPIRIYENDFGCTTTNSAACNAVTTAITETVNITGTLLVNYIGHASLNRWSGESIFLNEDVASMDNPTQLPIILSMTCLDGYWLYPNVDSLAKVFLVSEDKGAAGAFSPTGLGVATGHDELQRGFFDALLNQEQVTLGDAALEAKLVLFASGGNFDLMHTFTVFGDPAIRFFADLPLTPSQASQTVLSGETASYSLTISNTFETAQTYTVSLSGQQWETSAPATVGPVNPGQTENFTVTVNVPLSVPTDASDTVTVSVALASNPGVQSSSTLTTLTTTFATPGPIFIPIILRP